MEFVEEKVDITALLKGILNAYPGNSAILREYLQNSDDARATNQIFVLDERTHPTETLCDQSLCGAQGPALLTYNDGVLSERDWVALTTIHSSSKKADETQTGKNGLGFRASYHLTENPQVLSDGTLMILDPHRRLQDRNAGLKISIAEAGSRYPDQLKPFEHVSEIFAPEDTDSQFQGTIFRLPLRTAVQAQESRIKSDHTSVEEVRSLLQDFSQAELAEVILFLKHITQIEVHRIDVSGNRSLLGRVSIEKSLADMQDVYIRQTTLVKVDGTVEKRRWHFRSLDIDKNEAAGVISERLGYDVGNSLTADKLSPSIELATPSDGEPITGSLFTLLPLPIKTYFPVHLNAVFALTPDRQSLKNIEEVGNIKSRERRLVEWNRMIFEVWAPKAWADLIKDLSSSLQEPWSIWPPEEKNAYWMDLNTNLVREVVLNHSPVFPTIQKEAPFFISLDDINTLIAPPSATVDLLLLVALGMTIVQPPLHIFSILTSNKVSVAARELSPRALHVILAQGYQGGAWQPYDQHTVKEIINYLVFSTSPPSLSNLEGLPWFENSDGETVTLERRGVGKACIIPESEEEARLFATHPRMLAWFCLPEKLRITLLQSNFNALNVAPLKAVDVVQVLTVRFTCEGGFQDSDVAWVLDFLSWLSWHQVLQDQLFGRNAALSSLFLLPTTTGLRRLSDKAISMSDVAAANVWEMLGVPVLLNNLSSHVVDLLSKHDLLERPESTGFLPFVLDSLDPALQSKMSSQDFELLRRSIYSVVVHLLPSLTPGQKSVLEQLAVFSVRQITGDTTLSPIKGNRLYVNVEEGFPLPFQKTPTIYVDVRNPETRAFVQRIEHLNEKNIWDLVRIAMEYWNEQPVYLQNRFIDLIFENWIAIPTMVLNRLKELPFISVHGTNSLVRPEGLIHPRSPITPLYEDEGRIPSGRFAERAIVTIMEHLGFLHSSLESNIVQERLTYLSRSSLNDLNAFKKSIELVRLLNRFWEANFIHHIKLHRDSPWMPGTEPSHLISPEMSRDLYVGDHAHPKLYDLELKIFPEDVVRISEPKFREALGWSEPVPSHVLVEQFRKTILRPHDKDRYRRLEILIGYMAKLVASGNVSFLKSAREVVVNLSWIPAFASSVETVETEYALFPGVDLQKPFHRVHLTECRPFLLAMGCKERPTLDSMIRSLRKYKSFSESDIPAILALLKEISTHRPGLDPHLLVPAHNGQAYPMHDVYYPDTEDLLPSSLQNKFCTHRGISRALSDGLGIQPLSSLLLEVNEDHFDDDEQMGVDLVDRIQGFLREYDIQYALNEFLANADDARAKRFSIILDCRQLSFSRSGMISPAFHGLQRHASVILFNDAKLTEEDFKGLRRVGRGGKVDNEDTHGRHGLGALSFYYFTDVATIISGESVMILDPSSSYLPRTRHGGKRTSIIRKISDIWSQYPNHLRPYESLHGFSKDDSFNGTLFCLPLNSKISAENCDEERVRRLLDSSYRELAANAFFFTRLSEIRAEVLSDTPSLIWSLSATRTVSSPLDNGASYHFLELIRDQTHQPEKWIISTSAKNKIPEIHKATATGLKLTQSNLIVELAISLRPKIGLQSSSFFSTLRLPRTTSFPFHLNARFAISSNRQSIVSDSPDSRKARDPKADYNAWILSDVVPPLYLDTLTFLIQKYIEKRTLTKRSFWLKLSVDGEDMYRHLADAFHSLLAKSNNLLFKCIDGPLLSFKNSVFASGHIHPKGIIDSLIAVVASRLVVDYGSTGIITLGPRTVDPPYVKGVFRNTALKTIQALYSEGTIGNDHMSQLLLYVSGEPDLVGLPLLVLSTDTPVSIPGQMDRRIYVSENPVHAILFDTVPFLHSALSGNAFDAIWSSSDINITKLTSNNVNELIRDQLNHTSDDDKAGWLNMFWRDYQTLPGPPSLATLEQANVILVVGSLRHYSLQDCRPQHVVYFQNSDLRRMLSPALLGLGIDVLQPINNYWLTSYLGQIFPSPLVNILNCLQRNNIYDFRILPAEDFEKLTTWFESSIKSHIRSWQSQSPQIVRQHLFQIKLWPAHTSRGEDIYSASDLGMLPPSFPIKALMPYLQHRPTASYSHTLHDVILFCRSIPIGKKKKTVLWMSPESILASIQLPSSVHDLSELVHFVAFLRCLLGSFSTPSLSALSLSVFDTSGRMQPLVQLYDHTVSLFSTSFAYTPGSFVHPSLRDEDLVQAMRDLGLRSRISFGDFRLCAMAVQTSLQSYDLVGVPTSDELMNMSQVAFECYNDRLASLIMSNKPKWASLDVIRFVRPKNIHRQGASYLAENYYVGKRGLLLAPNDFVLPKFEPIVWTQRALFFDEPSTNLVALNTKLGVPDVSEVVAHLKILTTEIAPNHPGNSTLLSDIKATYKWLNDHAGEAREHMVLLEGEKLFLNVDDPCEDWWVGKWVMAQELVLNLHYDYGNMKRVKAFLQDYNTLLRASGCSTMLLSSREREEPAVTSTQSDIMSVFNEMRRGGEILDMVLIPTFNSPIDVLSSLDSAGVDMGPESDLGDSGSEEEAAGENLADVIENVDPSLRAHRVILAATIPFIRDWAEGWKHNKLDDLALVEFNGTSFGAKCILAFVYSGDFDYETPRADNFEDMKNLLYELLALLTIADEWNIPNLKTQIERHIIFRHDLVQRLLPLHEEILKVAERYEANDLKNTLNELIEGNQQLMKKLKGI